MKTKTKQFIQLAFLSVITLCLIGNIHAQDYADYTKCAEQDSLALVAFYQATDGDNWITQLYTGDEYPLDLLGDDVKVYYQTDYPNAGRGKWLQGPVKDWFGVLLEKRQIGNSTDSAWRVVHLHPTDDRRAAGDIGLNGYIPREVGLLTALEWFKVNGNIGLKNSELPDELYHETLTDFDIEAAYFKGIITDAFRNCTQLDYINMRYSYLDSLPVLDFMADADLEEAFVETGVLIWLYDSHFSYATLLPVVKHLMSVNKNMGYEARYQTQVGREKEIILEPGGTVTLHSDDAGEGGTYSWYKNGSQKYVYTQDYTVSETGVYSATVYNEYVAENATDDVTAYDVLTYTKNINVVSTPSAPVCDTAFSNYAGNEITLEFSKPMAVPQNTQIASMNLSSNGSPVSITDIERSGRLNNKYILTLASPVAKDATLSLSYTPGDIVCANGGALAVFTNRSVGNLSRKKPAIVSAITNVNGEGIILSFDGYIDPSSFTPSDFTINGSAGNSIDDIVLKAGELDDDISKRIELITSEYLSEDDVLTVNYTQGSLCGLYGGMPDSFSAISVENVVSAIRFDVSLKVLDGSESLTRIFIGGDIKSKAFALYDDGSNGDDVSDDHIWTKKLSLAPGTYNWEVYERIPSYDTIIRNDTILIVLDTDSENDSIISSTVLTLTVDETNGISGDTLFAYHNNTLTFILDLKTYLAENSTASADPYLMGMDEDWLNGIALDIYDAEAGLYSTQVEKQNTGASLSFVFRNGSIWENTTAVMRSHTITGNDTLRCTFGEIAGASTREATGIQNIKESIKLYPNPAHSYLYIEEPAHAKIKQVVIYNLSGLALIKAYESGQLNISHLQQGLYILKVSDTQNNVFYSEFLKQ